MRQNGSQDRKHDRAPAGGPERSEGNSTEDEGADASSQNKLCGLTYFLQLLQHHISLEA